MRYHKTATAILITAIIVLAAVINASENQDKPVVPGEKTMLFNGKDLTGWKPFVGESDADPAKVWSVSDDVICCSGKPAGYMRTEADYASYLLHVEWRWPGQSGNSGVLIHMTGTDKVWPKSLECQLHSGNAGDFWVIGGLETSEHAGKGHRVNGRRTIKLKDSSEKPLGQWNAYDIICKNDWVVVLVNGVLQNVATKCSATSGRICLQSEGAPIEFRNIYIEPLE